MKARAIFWLFVGSGLFGCRAPIPAVIDDIQPSISVDPRAEPPAVPHPPGPLNIDQIMTLIDARLGMTTHEFTFGVQHVFVGWVDVCARDAPNSPVTMPKQAHAVRVDPFAVLVHETEHSNVVAEIQHIARVALVKVEPVGQQRASGSAQQLLDFRERHRVDTGQSCKKFGQTLAHRSVIPRGELWRLGRDHPVPSFDQNGDSESGAFAPVIASAQPTTRSITPRSTRRRKSA